MTTDINLEECWNRLPEAAPFRSHFKFELAELELCKQELADAERQVERSKKVLAAAEATLDQRVSLECSRLWNAHELREAGF